MREREAIGDTGFLVIVRYGIDATDKLIFTEELVIIINDAVRKGMLV